MVITLKYGSNSSASLQDVERRIMTVWLLTSGYDYSDDTDIEVYSLSNQHVASLDIIGVQYYFFQQMKGNRLWKLENIRKQMKIY
jgi:hypothetical protein